MRRMLWVVAAAAASVVVMSASASAAGWNCSAAAVSGQPLGTPITANVGQTTCKAASGGANLPALPLPLQANVMSARTTLDGSASQPAQQTAGATGEVANLSVGVPSGSAPIPTTTIPVPGMGNVDITQALAGLLPPPPNPLLGVKLSSATASGSCVNGKPTLTGSSHVLGLTVAGQELPVDQAVSQAVTAIGGGTLDPSQLTSQPLPAPLNQIPPATLQPLLDALPDMAIPPTLAQIRVTPGSQTVAERDADPEGPSDLPGPRRPDGRRPHPRPGLGLPGRRRLRPARRGGPASVHDAQARAHRRARAQGLRAPLRRGRPHRSSASA